MFDSIRVCLLPLHRKANSFLRRLQSLRRAVLCFSRHRSPKQSKSKPSDEPLISPTPAARALSAQLRQVFDLIDANGDGKISPSELGIVLCRLDGYSKAAALEEAEVMVREMDVDGDGEVDLEEFVGAVTGSGKAAAAAEEEEEDFFCGEEECLREAFSIYDRNGDGRISAEELRRVLAGLGIGKNCSVRDCRSMIGGFDRDGDGFVDFEEFRSMMTVNPATTGWKK